MTKRNKNTDKLKSPDIKKILIDNKEILYKNKNEKTFTNPRRNNNKKLRKKKLLK